MDCLRQYLKHFIKTNMLLETYLRRHHSIAHISRTQELGSRVQLKGWVKALRKMKGNNFVDISDGSCMNSMQVVIPKKQSPKELTYGSSVQVNGTLSMYGNNQLEVKADNVEVVGECVVADGYPFQPRKSYNSDYVRQYLHLRNRTQSFASLLRLRSHVTKYVHDYFHDQGFIHIHTPILTSNDCEGAGEVFSVVPDAEELLKQMSSETMTNEKEVFFNHKSYLTVSGQLHLEAMARSLSRVYTFSPTFRAENSKSRLHLSEFYMIECELAFMDDIQQLLSTIESFVKTIIRNVLENHAEEIIHYRKVLSGADQDSHQQGLDDLQNIVDNPFIIMSYNAAVTILKRNQFVIQSDEGLNKEQELFLVKYTNQVPIFIVKWPKQVKPFYMKRNLDESEQVSAVDLLCPLVGEMAGGGLREDNYSTLESILQENNLFDKLSWYLELRKYGNVPTGGFGIGFERFLQVITGNDNIKDVIPYPRYPHHCKL